MSPFMLPMPSRPRRIYALKHSWTSSKRPAARPSMSNILHYDDMGQEESTKGAPSRPHVPNRAFAWIEVVESIPVR